jgi:hypothetical protein
MSLKCQNENRCSGLLDNARRIPIQVSCTSFKDSLACPACGRLHWESGHPIMNRKGSVLTRLFIEGDNFVNRDVSDVEVDRLPI